MAVIETWLKKHVPLYTAATRPPFILSIRDGSIHPSVFSNWLSQDYIFVRAVVPFVASVLLKACKESDEDSDMEVLLGGVASLNNEISWFKREASKRNVALTGVVPQKANLNYCRFLESLTSPDVKYTVAITALWAIQAVYQESFAHCLEQGSRVPDDLKEICQRLGNGDFRQYCHSLQSIANRCLSKAPDETVSRAEHVVLTVLELEAEFWNMSDGEV